MRFAAIAITNRCNFECKMCDIGQKNAKSSGMMQSWNADDELTPGQWETIINRLDISRVHIMGVEPLLYKKLDELLRRLGQKDREIWLTTNGWLLHEHLKAIVKFCDNTAISIDGLEKTHDKIRGVKGAFRRAFDGVVALKEAGKYVRVSYAVTPDNTADIIPLYKQLQDFGIPLIMNHYNYIHPISCQGFDCLPSNITFYNPKSVDVTELLSAVEYCRNASWLPRLVNLQELKQYYCEPPKTYKKKQAGCMVLKRHLRGERFSLAADGTFILPGRCWYQIDLGNALGGGKGPEGNTYLKEVVGTIEKKGLPPPCQRLCCAGQVIGHKKGVLAYGRSLVKVALDKLCFSQTRD